MSIVVSDSGGGGNFKPAPDGIHPCVCVDVVDLGMMKITFNGETKEQHKVRLVWEISETFEDEKSGGQRRFLVFSRLTASLGEKANLRKLLKSWRGRDFTPDELRGFDLENVVGAPGTIVVEHNQVGDKVYANVAHLTKADKNNVLEPSGHYVRFKDRPAKDGNGNGHASSSDSDGSTFGASDDEIDKLFAEQGAADNTDIPF